MRSAIELPILYRDPQLVAIHKPAGLLVHRSSQSTDRVFALQMLRDQIGQRVYPVHRLDRATSGVLLFGLSSESARAVVSQFEARSVDKRYLAVCRGWLPHHGLINHPVADELANGSAQPAQTEFRCLAQVELPYAVDRYPSRRYSLAEVRPLTGRHQQIRKHFKHISHHLIGDTTHGNGKHNRFFRQRFELTQLLLCAEHLAFDHPVSGERVQLHARMEPIWQRMFALFDWPNQSDQQAQAERSFTGQR